jgi:hypothetical protein
LQAALSLAQAIRDEPHRLSRRPVGLSQTDVI